MAAAEQSGDFEKRATPDEIATAREGIGSEVAAALATTGADALERDDWDILEETLGLLDAAHESAGAALNWLVNRLDASFMATCAEGQERIATAWETRRADDMTAACHAVLATYARQTERLMTLLLRHGSAADRQERIRGVAVRLLEYAAHALEAAFDKWGALTALAKALTAAEGTAAEPRIRERYERLRDELYHASPFAFPGAFKFLQCTTPLTTLGPQMSGGQTGKDSPNRATFLTTIAAGAKQEDDSTQPAGGNGAQTPAQGDGQSPTATAALTLTWPPGNHAGSRRDRGRGDGRRTDGNLLARAMLLTMLALLLVGLVGAFSGELFSPEPTPAWDQGGLIHDSASDTDTPLDDKARAIDVLPSAPEAESSPLYVPQERRLTGAWDLDSSNPATLPAWDWSQLPLYGPSPPGTAPATPPPSASAAGAASAGGPAHARGNAPIAAGRNTPRTLKERTSGGGGPNHDHRRPGRHGSCDAPSLAHATTRPQERSPTRERPLAGYYDLWSRRGAGTKRNMRRSWNA